MDAVDAGPAAAAGGGPAASVTDWSGGRYGERGECLLAPNPNLMTLDGTNTWVLREPGASQVVVVDPGPIEDGHLGRLVSELGDVGLVLPTHCATARSSRSTGCRCGS